MADFKFYTSYTAGNNVNVSRGEACVVQDSGRLRTGHIVDIRDNLSAHYATFNIATQDENTLNRQTPPVRYEGSGFYHLADRGKPGVPNDAKFFVTVKEGEDAAKALHAHMTGVSEGVMNPTLPVEQPAETSGNQPEAPSPIPALAGDEDGDGDVDKDDKRLRKQRQRGEV